MPSDRGISSEQTPLHLPVRRTPALVHQMNVRGEGQFWRSLQGQFGGAMHKSTTGTMEASQGLRERHGAANSPFASTPLCLLLALVSSWGECAGGKGGELLDVCFRYE